MVENAYNLTVNQRRSISRVLLGVLVAILAVAVYHLFRLASVDVAAESPQWEAVLLARVALAKLFVVVPAVVLALFGTRGAFILFDHSTMGPRLIHCFDTDDSAMKAAKKRNAGLIYAFLLLGMFTLLAGILR